MLRVGGQEVKGFLLMHGMSRNSTRRGNGAKNRHVNVSFQDL